MTGDAWSSGFVIISAVLAGGVLEACAMARRRRRRTPHVPPVPWRTMDRINHQGRR